MLSNFKNLMVAGALLFATLCSAPAIAAAQSGARTFTVINRSSIRIDHLFVSPTKETSWGWDQLGLDVLPPDYRFDLTVAPGWYDVKLVDQDSDSCVVSGLDFRDGESWTITDGVLLACEVLSAR